MYSHCNNNPLLLSLFSLSPHFHPKMIAMSHQLEEESADEKYSLQVHRLFSEHGGLRTVRSKSHRARSKCLPKTLFLIFKAEKLGPRARSMCLPNTFQTSQAERQG
jgi:hypothetical protein